MPVLSTYSFLLYVLQIIYFIYFGEMSAEQGQTQNEFYSVEVGMGCERVLGCMRFTCYHPILKLRELKSREVKRFAQGPMTRRWQGKDSKSRSSGSKLFPLPYTAWGDMPYPHTQITNSRKEVWQKPTLAKASGRIWEKTDLLRAEMIWETSSRQWVLNWAL